MNDTAYVDESIMHWRHIDNCIMLHQRTRFWPLGASLDAVMAVQTGSLYLLHRSRDHGVGADEIDMTLIVNPMWKG